MLYKFDTGFCWFIPDDSRLTVLANTSMPHSNFYILLFYFCDLFQVAQKCTHHYAQDDPEETAEKEEKQEEVEEVHLVWFSFLKLDFLPHPSNNNTSAEGMKCCHFTSPHQPITVSNCWLKLLQPVARSSKLSKFNFYALSTMPFDAILQPTLPPPTSVLYVF